MLEIGQEMENSINFTKDKNTMPINPGSEVFRRKGSSGMGFQVTFKGSGFFTGTKGNGGFDSPRAIFGGVGDLPGIMGKETGF